MNETFFWNGTEYKTESIRAAARQSHIEVVPTTDLVVQDPIRDVINIAYRFNGKLHLLMGEVTAQNTVIRVLSKHQLKRCAIQQQVTAAPPREMAYYSRAR